MALRRPGLLLPAGPLRRERALQLGLEKTKPMSKTCENWMNIGWGYSGFAEGPAEEKRPRRVKREIVRGDQQVLVGFKDQHFGAVPRKLGSGAPWGTDGFGAAVSCSLAQGKVSKDGRGPRISHRRRATGGLGRVSPRIGHPSSLPDLVPNHTSSEQKQN